MSPRPSPAPQFSRRRGSALLTVVMFIGIMLLLTGSLLTYSSNQRRSNERNKLTLRARNMAENVAIYASEQLTTKLRRLRSPSKLAFDTGSNQVYLPPDDVLVTENSTAGDVEVKAGLTSSTGLQFIDPDVYPNDPNKGLQVDTATVQIIAKSTMSNNNLGSVTSYVEQDLAVDLTPLFQFGVFYNMDMEYGPGPNMTITGPVHTNGNLIARMQTGATSTLTFQDRVSAAGGFYANTAYKGSTWMADDSEDDGPGGTGKLYFTDPSGNPVGIYASSTWRDHFYLSNSGTHTSTPSATALTKFESFATTYLKGNLLTSVNDTPKLELPDVSSYDETTNPKGGRELIDEPYKSGVPDASVTGDSAELANTKISRTAGLYIVVNPDDETRNGKNPDGTQISMLPRSYRCFLTYIDSGGTRQTREVVLPGQPSYGHSAGPDGVMDTSDDTMYTNNLPNRFTDKTMMGVNQVLRIPASGRACDDINTNTVLVSTGLTTGYPTSPSSSNTWPYYNGSSPYVIPDAYFFDIRRATNNTGHPWNRPSNNYLLRPIAKIDFDMTRFRLAVERTLKAATTSSAVYDVNVPNDANWTYSIYNSSATTRAYNLGVNYGTITDYSGITADNTDSGYPYATDPFRMYWAPADDTNADIQSNPNGSYGMALSDFINTSSPCPWFDGVTVYIQSVDAEDHTNIATGAPDRVDSGVRLWNGRGPVISLDKGTYPGRTGFTLATNDALYVIGHFNADGAINSSSSDSTLYGGYSARYADSADEMLASVMGDAITILSQPVFAKKTTDKYYQKTGWNDSLSANRYYSSNYSTTW